MPLFTNTSLTRHGNRDATRKLVLSAKNNLHRHLVPSRLHAPAHASPARPRANRPKPDCATLDHMHGRTLPSPAQRNQAAKPGKQREQQKGARAQGAARRSHTAAEHHHHTHSSKILPGPRDAQTTKVNSHAGPESLSVVPASADSRPFWRLCSGTPC